ncbi:MAG: hypothetical protein ACERKY_05365 [Anaerolineales bacterium]
MKTPTIFFVTFLTIAVIVMNGCAPSSTPIATTEIHTPTLVLPSATAVSPTQVLQGRTLQVTSTEDSGHGTLRLALLDASNGDTITFDPVVFPPNAPETISVGSGLPQISQGYLTIDASNAGVILDGSHLPRDTWIPGIEIISDGNTILGLQVINFTGTGIVVALHGRNNTIGGDRSIGAGPSGQGNLSGSNDFGIGLWDFASHNIVTGNLVGTDVSGTHDLGNRSSGVWVTEGGMENVIGPDNIIANNDNCGIGVGDSDSVGNTLTQNSIHDNDGVGICLGAGGNTSLGAPFIADINLTDGLVNGTACANCTVEIYSDSDDEGAVYEGQAVADGSGVFTLNKGAAFVNTNITSTTTDANGNTSEFSWPAGRTTSVKMLQEGNSQPRFWLLPRQSNQLVADTRLGAGLYSSNIWNDIPHLDSILNDYTDMGIKRLDTSMQEIEEPIDWNRSEYEIFMEYDRLVDDLNENGVAVNYLLHFWDKTGHASGKELSTPRFKTEEQIQDFLEYVRFVVSHFKDRVQYYTIWSEPDACGGSGIKCIEPNDYIDLVRQTIPIIREEDPRAKVALAPNVLFFAREYLFTILTSDVIQTFDAIQWHGIYDVVPNSEFYGNYYYEYPSIIQEIKQTATAHGFDGEYWGTELTWCSEEFPTCHAPDQPWGIQKTDKIAAKYDARGFVMHLGMDVGVGWGGLESTSAPWTYPTVRNLNTVMAGTTPNSLIVNIESEATNIMSYAFSLPSGDMLLALWTNGVAVDDHPGVKTTLTFPGLSAQDVLGIDVLNGVEQELITETENGDLIIRNLLVKDYPIILRLVDWR